MDTWMDSHSSERNTACNSLDASNHVISSLRHTMSSAVTADISPSHVRHASDVSLCCSGCVTSPACSYSRHTVACNHQKLVVWTRQQQ